MAAVHTLRLSQAKLVKDEPRPWDLWLLVPTLALVSLGVAMVYSASIPTVASHGSSVLAKLIQELVFVAAGVAGMVFAVRIPLRRLEKSAWGLLVATTALLLGVFAMPSRNGSHSWYFFPGGVSFQPSEMAKIVLVIVTAKYFAHFPQGLSGWRQAVPPFAVLFLIVGLVAKEPDMGTAAVTAMAMMVYFHIAGARTRHLLFTAGIGMLGATAMVLKHPYQLARIISFFKGSEVELAGGYQTSRSLIALGSGGLGGSGYCHGIEKYFYLPAATTDSILPVIGEELGLLATWGVLAIFAVLVLRGMKIAGRAPDRFSGLVAAGVTSLIGVQAVLNVAVATGCIPATGVTLPFVSYGGSSLLFSMIAMGLLLNVSRRCEESRVAGETR